MAGTPELLVDAVVAHLDVATFSQTFTPTKKLVPIFERDQLSGWDVSVHVGPTQRDKQARSGAQTKTYSVGVVIRYPADSDQAGLETKAGEVIQLCEEIKDSLATPNMIGLVPVEVDQDVPFDLEKVSSAGLFFAQLTFKYKGI